MMRCPNLANGQMLDNNRHVTGCRLTGRRRDDSQGALWCGAEHRARLSIQVDHLCGRRVGLDTDTGEVRWRFQIARPMDANLRSFLALLYGNGSC